MRIAQVAPLYESCPPQLYGGTERVVSYLTEELVRQGHEVTLFASGDSQTKAMLQAPCARALRLDGQCIDPLPYHFIALHRLAQSADEFDIIHFHTDYLHFPLFAQQWSKTLTTLHGRLDLPDLPPILREFAMMPLVSISNAQRVPVPWANWYGTVHHGLPTSLYTRCGGDGAILPFSAESVRRSDRIGLSKSLAELDCRSQLRQRSTKSTGLITRPGSNRYSRIHWSSSLMKSVMTKKKHFWAMRWLFPIDWPEPFGLAVIEAMATGTPIIAFGQGSVPEIVDHGVTGFVVDDVDEAVAAIPLVKALDRSAIRRRFEERFSVERMARDYLALYDSVLRRGTVDAVLNSAAAAQAAANAA